MALGILNLIVAFIDMHLACSGSTMKAVGTLSILRIAFIHSFFFFLSVKKGIVAIFSSCLLNHFKR